MQETRYFSHAWALLTKDKGWPKVIVMLALWMLIPIVGWLWVLGYEAEWARLIAWGVEGSPKQKNINLSQCLTSGWRVFVGDSKTIDGMAGIFITATTIIIRIGINKSGLIYA